MKLLNLRITPTLVYILCLYYVFLSFSLLDELEALFKTEFRKCYPDLVIILPLDDVLFTALLEKNEFFPSDYFKATMKSKSTRYDKAEYILDQVVKRDILRCFKNLLNAMEEYGSTPRERACEIKKNLRIRKYYA